MQTLDPTSKPLNRKAYGSICHLPGSRLGPGDHKLNEGQTRILTEKPRDHHDTVIVQEKLDGSNVCVANVDGQIVPLIRAGYQAIHSRREQHRLFALWVFEYVDCFSFLKDGERLCGEWLAEAHGTRYALRHDPFVAFDIMRGGDRAPFGEFADRCGANGVKVATLLHRGDPCPVSRALELLGPHGFHGAIDPVEGAVWRVERRGQVDFLGKYVRPDKVDGCYLSDVCGKPATWNWRPTKK